MSLPKYIWYRVLSYIVQIGLNWIISYYDYLGNRANRIRNRWDGYSQIMLGYMHYMAFTFGILTQWDKVNMTTELL